MADPVVATNTGFSVDEGDEHVILQAELETTDEDSAPETLIYTVLAPPEHGQLSPSTGFSQKDINDGLVTYTHDGSESESDAFSFSVSDGSTSATGNVVITIVPVDDQPVIAVNTGITVAESDTHILTPQELQVTDDDNEPSELVYTITTLPENGTLTPSDTFTQADINNGDVSYTHDGSETTEDSFEFEVTDGTTVREGVVLITITSEDDDPVLSTNQELKPERGEDYIITSEDLEVTDADEGDEVYLRIDTLPLEGILLFEGQPVAEEDLIAMTDIELDKLVYRHLGLNIDPDEFDVTPVSFIGGNEDDVAEGVQDTVDISPQNNDGWMLIVQPDGEPPDVLGVWSTEWQARVHQNTWDALGLGESTLFIVPYDTNIPRLELDDDRRALQAIRRRPLLQTAESEYDNAAAEVLAALEELSDLQALVAEFGPRLETDKRNALDDETLEDYLRLRSVYDTRPGAWERVLYKAQRVLND